MSGKEFCIILTTTDNVQTADKITESLLKQKLVACVQIDSVRSFYNWGASLERSDEYRLQIKALYKNYADIEKTIVDLHNYDIPQIIMLDIAGGSKAYLKWVLDSCPR